MTKARSDERRREDARRVGAWRRLAICFAPPSCVHVAMFIAENSRAGSDGVIVARPLRDRMAKVTRSTPRTAERRVAALVRAQWLSRVGPRAQTGVAQEYRLRLPEWLPHEVIEAAKTCRPGMWDRLIGQETDASVGQSAPTDRRGVHERPTRRAKETDASVGPTGVIRESTGGACVRDGVEGALAHAAPGDEPRRADPVLAGHWAKRIMARLGGQRVVGQPCLAPAIAAESEARFAAAWELLEHGRVLSDVVTLFALSPAEVYELLGNPEPEGGSAP